MPSFLGNAALKSRDGATYRFAVEGHTFELSFLTTRIARVRLVETRAWPQYVEPQERPVVSTEVTEGTATKIATASWFGSSLTLSTIRNGPDIRKSIDSSPTCSTRRNIPRWR